ncbi:hypothetical protein KUTeg_023215 [Tegillarca granosa]|uniref:Phosphatidylinositol-4-phosphate 3-kinase n=1 Tax=Tegillarca granosa TaxID=220873 RepID=A0ABQ9E6R9_TEGGR|nr:hypothetical protein KUTeg_023215 [Tegillarca granosa]
MQFNISRSADPWNQSQQKVEQMDTPYLLPPPPIPPRPKTRQIASNNNLKNEPPGLPTAHFYRADSAWGGSSTSSEDRQFSNNTYQIPKNAWGIPEPQIPKISSSSSSMNQPIGSNWNRSHHPNLNDMFSDDFFMSKMPTPTPFKVADAFKPQSGSSKSDRGCTSDSNSPEFVDVSQKQKSQGPPLISLSPPGTLKPRIGEDGFQQITYSMDLEGIDFSGSVENSLTDEKRSLSSSAENLPSSNKTALYPDISHAFKEVRQDEVAKYTNLSHHQAFPQPSHNFAFTSNSNNGLHYGWNPEIFIGQTNTANNSGQQIHVQNQPSFHNATYTGSEYQWGFHNNVKNASTNPFHQRPQSCFTNNFGSFVTDSNHIQRSSSHSEFEGLRSEPNPSIQNNDMSFDPYSEFENGNFSPVEGKPPRARKSSDLMEFSGPSETEYMSLDCFDPLYEKARRESVSSKDSLPQYSFSEPIMSPGSTGTVGTKYENLSSSPKPSLYPNIPHEISDEDLNTKQSYMDRGSCDDFIKHNDSLENFLQDDRIERKNSNERPPRPDRWNSRDAAYEKLRKRMFVDEESEAFCQMVAKLKSGYKSSDKKINRGYIVSPMCENKQPAILVELVIETVIYNHLHIDHQQNLSARDFILKVYDKSEYLLNDTTLSKYEYVLNCLTLDQDIKFFLMRREDVALPFLRTRTAGDFNGHILHTSRETQGPCFKVGLKHMECINESDLIQSRGLSQAVKAICITLAKIETIDVTKTLARAENIIAQLMSHSSDNYQNYTNEISEQDTKLAIRMYCRTFHTDFHLGPAFTYIERQDVTAIDDNFILHIATAHRIPMTWNNKETRLCITLCGVKNLSVNPNANDNTKVVSGLGSVTIQLYNSKGHMIRGSHLIPLKMYTTADPLTPFCSVLEPDSVLLQVNFPDFGKQIVFPEVSEKKFQSTVTRHTGHYKGSDGKGLCQADELGILWQYRHHLHDYPNLLPWILQGSSNWDWTCLSDTYSLLRDWTDLDPMQALELLLPQMTAVQTLKKMSTDELIDFIPQLIQALKYESYHASALSELLLEQSCRSIRFAHQLLKGAAQDSTYKHRYELMFVALVSVAGDALYQEFRKQEELVKILTTAAEKVQVSKDKDSVLKRELQGLYELFCDKGSVLLPYNPGLEVSGIDMQVGDDLRQDTLTMQMIKIMNRLWLKEGLDLKMITFSCLATGPKRGLVELITESDTLRKIQVSYGVTGSFKDRPIKEWLQKHNPTELEYQKAVENFTCSCAGYCVATYVLGICDRHNDNIMLKQSGHMFHIDFNKFLGDAQKFINFKRDRVPFVLTSDMAFVINNGEKRSDRFQRFVDMCCEAFNVLRKNANLFLNLMLENSLKSVFTQFNFFIHNLAQLKFSSHQEGALLSFVPKTYSVNTDGKLKKVHVYGYQKRYTPEKHYVERENQNVPTYIFRHHYEFAEFRNKLAELYPKISWTPMSGRLRKTNKKKNKNCEEYNTSYI